MCFVIFAVLGAFSIALWMHANLFYAALTGAVSIVFLLFFVRKMVKNGPCIFGKRRDC